jgi:hypothetical protein
MTLHQFLEHPRFRPVFIAFAVFSASFFALNIFVIGGNDFYQLVNSLVPAVLAGLVSFQVYTIWEHSAQDTAARRVWTYLLAGIAVWAIGDVIWAFYTLVLHVDVPYPSWADALWVSGYFFLFIGLYAQFRAYHVQPTRRLWQNIVIFALALVVLTTYFVLLPIVQSFDPARLLESLLNVFYPILDLILLPLCFLILGTLGEGKLAVSWKMITLGFMIRAISDLVFSYITWQEIYMPGGTVNLVSAVYDFIYCMSYLTAGLGFVAYRLLTMEAPLPPVEVAAKPEQPEAPKNIILISTDSAHRVISFSDNLLALLKKDDSEIKNASLYELLSLDENVIQVLESELFQHGVVDALLFPVKNSEGKTTEVRLSALAVYYQGKSFRGANIVLGTLSPLGVTDNLSAESQGMVRSILLRTGNPERETRAALSAYFNTQLGMLDDLVRQYGGKTVAQTMRMVINEAALKNGWDVRKDDGDFVILNQGDTNVLAASMIALLADARAYAVEMVGVELVNAEISRVNERTNPGVMNAINAHGLRLDP